MLQGVPNILNLHIIGLQTSGTIITSVVSLVIILILVTLFLVVVAYFKYIMKKAKKASQESVYETVVVEQNSSTIKKQPDVPPRAGSFVRENETADSSPATREKNLVMALDENISYCDNLTPSLPRSPPLARESEPVAAEVHQNEHMEEYDDYL